MSKNEEYLKEVKRILQPLTKQILIDRPSDPVTNKYIKNIIIS